MGGETGTWEAEAGRIFLSLKPVGCGELTRLVGLGSHEWKPTD